MYQQKENSRSFESDLRAEIILDQEAQRLSGWILYRSLFYIAQNYRLKYWNIIKGLKYIIAGSNISIFQETPVQAEILKHSQEVEFTNKLTGKNIQKFSRGGIYKPWVQAEVL